MKLVLMRHGKPCVSHSGKMSGAEFTNWIKMYDSAPLDLRHTPPDESLAVAKECGAVICSTLRRSVESAKELELGNRAEVLPNFVEVEMPSYNFLSLRFTENMWLILFRVLWFLGYAPNSESYSDAKLRAYECVDKLVAAAELNDSVVFVGHGILNSLIAKELAKRGWRRSVKAKTGYWQFSVLDI